MSQEEEERKGKKPARRPKKKKVEAEEEKIRGPHLIDIGGCCEFFLESAVHFWEGGDAEQALSAAPDDGSAPTLVAQAYAAAVNSSADEHLMISTESGLLFDVKDWISPNGPGLPLIASSLQSFPLYAAVLVPIEAFLTHHARTDWIANPGMPALEATRLLGALSALRSVIEKLGEDAISGSIHGGHGAVLAPPGGAEDGELEAGEVTRGAGRAVSPGSPHGDSDAGEVEVSKGDEPLVLVKDGVDVDMRDLHEIMSECCAKLLKSTSLQVCLTPSSAPRHQAQTFARSAITPLPPFFGRKISEFRNRSTRPGSCMENLESGNINASTVGHPEMINLRPFHPDPQPSAP